MQAAETIVVVLAHNEERRIGVCLASLPLGDPAIAVHVVVNGSTDRTAEIARAMGGARVTVHEWQQGGKARSWNRMMFDTPGIEAEAYVFVDGDAEVTPGSIPALMAALATDPLVNAAAGLPRNGRSAERYRADMITGHGMFGDLYALSGSFVTKLRASGIRLPEDLVGDDGLIGALAKTDLADERDWCDSRIQPSIGAGFLCEPMTAISPLPGATSTGGWSTTASATSRIGSSARSCARQGRPGCRSAWPISIPNGLAASNRGAIRSGGGLIGGR